MPAPKGNTYRRKEAEPAKAFIHFRISQPRKEAYKRAARKAGATLTDWTTNVLDRAADYQPRPKV